jgi:outer membrane protein OmpA-like peptidoglycan-associated protein
LYFGWKINSLPPFFIMKHTILSYLLGAAIISVYGCGSPKQTIVPFPSHVAEIINLGPSVNSSADDFAPTITANGTRLYFTSNRDKRIVEDSDFWVSRSDRGFWSSAQSMGAPINTLIAEGAPSISADGQSLYFAAARSDAIGKTDIYTASLSGKTWGDIRNVGPGVNSSGWESHPSISPDGQRLYFVSDRSGGEGGIDIWYSERNEIGGWSEGKNLGPVINTGSDEVSPFIAADNMTLYFASGGHPGLAGTDLFVSRRIQGKWSVPENMGKPINSNENDEFLTLSAEGSVIYFASRRSGGSGGLDLYKVDPNPFPPSPVLVLSGTVRDANTREALAASITVRDAATGTVLSGHSSNTYTGEYVIVLKAGVSYAVTYDALTYLPDSVILDLSSQKMYGEQKQDMMMLRERAPSQLRVLVSTDVLKSDFSLLDPSEEGNGLLIEEIQAGETVPLLPYVFFAKGSAIVPSRYVKISRAQTGSFTTEKLPDGAIAKYLQILNIIGKRMMEDMGSSIVLTGVLADDERQQGVELAKERAEAVKAYLQNVWNIDPARIETRAMTTASNASSENTPEGLDENRRVEFTSTSSSLLREVNTRSIEKIVTPPVAHFFPKVFAESGLDSWKLTISQGGRELFVREGKSLPPDTIAWDWKNSQGELPASDAQYTFSLIASDTDGNSATSQEQDIPVSVVSLRKKSVENLPGRTIERMNLILFGFDKARLDGKNRKMLKLLMGLLKQRSIVTVRGFTDALGDEEYNMKLSRKRASEVRKELVRQYPRTPIRSEAVGESELLYSQDSPEGRFYSRTVVIIIETQI